jgi:predicted nucleic acid-binding protein
VTSKPGERPVAAIAADANVLLSAVLGHAALRLFTQTDISVLTTRGVLRDVREYLPVVARQYDMLPQALEAQLRLLAVRECDPSEYAHAVEAASRAIAKRDPHDVDLLALALAFEIPVWSNDSDFKGAGVEWYTTARLLRHLGI